MQRIVRSIGLVALGSLLAMAPLRAQKVNSNPDLLRVALLPDENASTIIKNNEPLKLYLEQKVGKKVELVVTTDYSSMIEAMRRGRIDMAYFGPLSYVMAKEKAPAIEAFAAQIQKGSATYRSVLIVNTQSGISTIKDIRGKVVAFGDPASTSSHLIPKSVLRAAGLTEKVDYQEQFVGNHDAVALIVQNGKAQAGGLSEPIFLALIEKKIIDPTKVKVLQTSQPFPNYPWTLQGGLAPELKEQIRKAFYELKDPAVLKTLKAEGFAPVQDKAYDGIRELGRILKLDFASLAK
jgi:phosphonate transport system substrate-binding protein